MKSIAIGLALAVFAAAISPAASFAADKDKAKAGGVAVGDAKSHAQGMTDVPALIQTTHANCTPTDANMMGQSKAKDAAGKEVSTKFYEATCQEGLGYIFLAPEGAAPSAFDCLALSVNKPKAGEADKGQLYCRLPGNAAPADGLQPILAKAGVTCTQTSARWMGAPPDDSLNQYEVLCSEGPAYVLQVPTAGSAQKLTAVDCFTLSPGACQYFPKDKFLARITTMAAPANRTCTASDARYMGTTSTNKNSFYELACTDEKSGFVLQVDATGKFVSAIDCARASAIGGGCTLTAASAASTQENATYAKLAKEIGYPCDVKSYHSQGQDQSGREVVELACADHPDGAITFLPTDKGQKGEYWNCARADAHGLKCVVNPKESTFAKLSAQVGVKGKTCQVKDFRGLGTSAAGDDFLEVACTGGPGFVIEYLPGSDTVKSVLSCAEAKGIGGGCKL